MAAARLAVEAGGEVVALAADLDRAPRRAAAPTSRPDWRAARWRRTPRARRAGPCTSTLAAICCVIGLGWAPIRPAATWAFCARTALDDVVRRQVRARPSCRDPSRCAWSAAAPNSCARPTPSMRRISPSDVAAEIVAEADGIERTVGGGQRDDHQEAGAGLLDLRCPAARPPAAGAARRGGCGSAPRPAPGRSVPGANVTVIWTIPARIGGRFEIEQASTPFSSSSIGRVTLW